LTKKQLMNGSKPPSNGSRTLHAAPDPLDRARQAIEDGRAATRKLDSYDDWEEPTGKHEVTVNLVNPHPPTPPQPSQPEVTVTQPTPGVIAVVTTLTGKVPPLGATIVLVVAIVAFAAYHIVKMITAH
jgi:hypothetical protein